MAKNREQKTGQIPSADFPFESRFAAVDGHRIHYIERGKGDPVLFIHGNPTWSYIWRNVLPAVTQETGRRGIALDLLGFGKSDKPDTDYALEFHARIVEGFIEKLGLRNVVLVLQDWGGPLGAAYAVKHPPNINGIVFMETFLWDVAWKDFGPARVIFRLFRTPAGYIMNQFLNMFVNRVIPGTVVHKDHLTPEVMRRYREPFPDRRSRKAIRRFPQLILVKGEPMESAEFISDIESGLPSLASPVLWLRATPGVIITEDTEYRLTVLKKRLPQLEIREFGAGLHYLQEDDPERLSRLIVEWMRTNKLAEPGKKSAEELRMVA